MVARREFKHKGFTTIMWRSCPGPPASRRPLPPHRLTGRYGIMPSHGIGARDQARAWHSKQAQSLLQSALPGHTRPPPLANRSVDQSRLAHSSAHCHPFTSPVIPEGSLPVGWWQRDPFGMTNQLTAHGRLTGARSVAPSLALSFRRNPSQFAGGREILTRMTSQQVGNSQPARSS